MNDTTGSSSSVDHPTLIAITAVAYILANCAHEGAGHGGACVLMGGRPVALSAVFFECDETALSASAQRWIAAAGTLANLALGSLALALLARRLHGNRPSRYFLWLLMTINLLQAAGYFLFSGVGNIGDWASVIRGATPPALWRAALAVAGGVASLGSDRVLAA